MDTVNLNIDKAMTKFQSWDELLDYIQLVRELFKLEEIDTNQIDLIFESVMLELMQSDSELQMIKEALEITDDQLVLGFPDQ